MKAVFGFGMIGVFCMGFGCGMLAVQPQRDRAIALLLASEAMTDRCIATAQRALGQRP